MFKVFKDECLAFIASEEAPNGRWEIVVTRPAVAVCFGLNGFWRGRRSWGGGARSSDRVVQAPGISRRDSDRLVEVWQPVAAREPRPLSVLLSLDGEMQSE